jgi:hypothetical protein
MLEEKQVIDFHYRQSDRTGKWLFIIYLFIWDYQSVKDCFHDYCFEGGMFFYENEVVLSFEIRNSILVLYNVPKYFIHGIDH